MSLSVLSCPVLNIPHTLCFIIHPLEFQIFFPLAPLCFPLFPSSDIHSSIHSSVCFRRAIGPVGWRLLSRRGFYDSFRFLFSCPVSSCLIFSGKQSPKMRNPDGFCRVDESEEEDSRWVLDEKWIVAWSLLKLALFSVVCFYLPFGDVCARISRGAGYGAIGIFRLSAACFEISW